MAVRCGLQKVGEAGCISVNQVYDRHDLSPTTYIPMPSLDGFKPENFKKPQIGVPAKPTTNVQEFFEMPDVDTLLDGVQRAE